MNRSTLQSIFLIFLVFPTVMLLSQERGGFPVQSRPLFSGYGGFGTSEHLDLIPSEDSPGNGRTLLIALPQGDPAGSLVVTAFLDLVRAKGAPLPVRIALLADEEPDHLGLRDLLDRYEDGEELVLLYLDLGMLPRALELQYGSLGTIAPLSALAPLTESLSDANIPIDIPVPYNELYRLGLVGGPEALRLAHGRDIPALLLAGRQEPKVEGAGTYDPAAVAGAVYAYAEALAQAGLEKDYHYTVLRYGPILHFLGEGTTVLLFIAVFSVVLALVSAYSVTHRRYLIALWTVFFKRSWLVSLYLAILFLSLLGSERIFTFLAPGGGGYGGAALTLMAAVSLYSLASPLTAYLKLPRRAHFYGHAGVILISLGALGAAAMDITFLPIFLWATVFAFLAALAASPQGAFVWAIMAPMQILGALGTAVGSGDPTLATLILSSSWKSRLFISFLILPFLFLFKRVSLLTAGRKTAPNPLRIWLPRLVFFLGTVGAVLSYGYSITSEPPPAERPPAAANLQPRLELETSTFLDRRIVKITLSAEEDPDLFELALEAGEGERGIVIYDVPMPYKTLEGGRRVDFVLGRGPDNPLTIELVLPAEFRGTLHGTAVADRAGTVSRETVSAPVR